MPRRIKPTFARWKREAQIYCNGTGVIAGDALWDDKDSYSLLEEATEAWSNGESPKVFVDRMFAEDFAVMEGDRLLQDEAFEAGEQDEDDDEEIKGEKIL